MLKLDEHGLLYFRPFLKGYYVDLINENADRDVWITTLKDAVRNQAGEDNWEMFGNGWTAIIKFIIDQCHKRFYNVHRYDRWSKIIKNCIILALTDGQKKEGKHDIRRVF